MASATKANSPLPALTNVSDGSNFAILSAAPYDVEITVVGDSPLLFHAYNAQSVEAKARAKKGSESKKSDDVESYVYRDENGYLGIPGLNFCAALAYAAKRHQDPSSPRKSAYDLVRAVVFPTEILSLFRPKIKTWDYLDARRVNVVRAAITRVRPGLKTGWRIMFRLRCASPDMIPPEMLYKLTRDAGMFQGLCDHRPTFGRFSIHEWKVITEG